MNDYPFEDNNVRDQKLWANIEGERVANGSVPVTGNLESDQRLRDAFELARHWILVDAETDPVIYQRSRKMLDEVLARYSTPELLAGSLALAVSVLLQFEAALENRDEEKSLAPWIATTDVPEQLEPSGIRGRILVSLRRYLLLPSNVDLVALEFTNQLGYGIRLIETAFYSDDVGLSHLVTSSSELDDALEAVMNSISVVAQMISEAFSDSSRSADDVVASAPYLETTIDLLHVIGLEAS